MTKMKPQDILIYFKIPEQDLIIHPAGQGFINDTYFIKESGEKEFSWILQRKNKYVFRNIPGMIANIRKISTHIEQKDGVTQWNTIHLIPLKSGEFYFKDVNDDYWAMFSFVKGSRTYLKVESPYLAYAGGKAIGNFQKSLTDFKEELTVTIPGFHDIRHRFRQWDETLKADRAGRLKSVKSEINDIENRRELMINFFQLIEEGKIPQRIAHNDTKISNVLFNKKDEVLGMIDLDTVFRSSVLYDFGDAVRTYTNTGEEDDPDPEKINIELGYFEALAKGYLEETLGFLNEAERKYIAFSGRYIAYEQTLRFLMDYLDGDIYYKTIHPHHNLQRTRAQYRLLLSMEENYDKMERVVERTIEQLH